MRLSMKVIKLRRKLEHSTEGGIWSAYVTPEECALLVRLIDYYSELLEGK